MAANFPDITKKKLGTVIWHGVSTERKITTGCSSEGKHRGIWAHVYSKHLFCSVDTEQYILYNI